MLEERRHQRFARRKRGGALLDPALEGFVDLGERLLGLLGRRDVVGDADEAGVLAGDGPPRLRFRPEPAPLPVAASKTGLDRDELGRGIDGRRLLKNARQVVGMEGPAPVERERLLVAAAKIVEIGLIDELAPVVGAGDPDQHGGAVGDGAESSLAFGNGAFRQPVRGDVGHDHVDAKHVAARVAMRDVDDLGECDAAASRKVDLVGDLLSRQRPLELRPPRRIHRRRHDLLDAPADDLGSRPLEPGLVGPVDEAEDLIAVDVGNEDRQGVRDRPQPVFARPRLLLRALPFGDVGMGADQSERRAGLVALDLRDRSNPSHRAVGRPHDPVFRDIRGGLAIESREEALDGLGAIVRMDAPHPVLMGFDCGLRGQPVDAQVLGRAQAREAAPKFDAHASDAADFLNPGEFEFALAEPLEHGPALGRVAEGDADPVAEREGAHLVPAVGHAGGKALEHLLFAFRHHLAVAALELAADDGRRDLPQEPADHLFAPQVKDVLGRAIEGGEPPVRVEGEEPFGKAVEKFVDHRNAVGRDAGQRRDRCGGRSGRAGRGSFCAHVAKPR